jgi:hypothetical protein
MRIKRTKVLSTKVSERDNHYMQIMVNRYYEKRIIKQAKISTLLRLIVKRFLRGGDCPEYEQKTSTNYQREINDLYSDPNGNNRFPQSYQLRKTSYTQETPSVAETTAVKRSTSYADLMRQL